MLARLYADVPFTMAVPTNTEFALCTYEDEGCQVTVMPPGRSDRPIHGLVPDNIKLDGIDGFAANTVHIVFRKEVFNRRRGAPVDPPMPVLERAVSSLLTRLRFVTRSPYVAADVFGRATWRLRYLQDDGSEFYEDKDLVRGLGEIRWQLSMAAVGPAVWNDVHSLPPDFAPPPWDAILLDAYAALPRVGTAVVLAATALEVLIADVLDGLSKNSQFPIPIWTWINNRSDHKAPSVEEQFDALLSHFTGHSLKEETTLWQGMMNLKTARNKFVHEGVARVGGKPVTPDDAAVLVAQSSEIAAWIRNLLPLELRWRVFAHPTTASFSVPIK